MRNFKYFLILFILNLFVCCSFFKSEKKLYPIIVDGKFGYIDQNGIIVINPQFSRAGNFYEGLAFVYINDKYGFINGDGKFEINPQFDLVLDFSEGLVGVKKGGKWGFIDKDGSFIINPQYDQVGQYSEGLASVKIGEKWGYIDKEGKYRINPQFDQALCFSEGLAGVKQGDKWGFIDKDGNFVINLQYDQVGQYSEGLASVKIGDKWGYIDKEGKYKINPQFDQGLDFSEGLAGVKQGDKWGYIDKDGKYVVNLQFDEALSFSNEIASVEVNGKWGFIDRDGDYIIPAQYAGTASSILGSEILSDDNLLGVVEEEGWGYITKEGNLVWYSKFIEDTIENSWINIFDDNGNIHNILETPDKGYLVVIYQEDNPLQLIKLNFNGAIQFSTEIDYGLNFCDVVSKNNGKYLAFLHSTDSMIPFNGIKKVYILEFNSYGDIFSVNEIPIEKIVEDENVKTFSINSVIFEQITEIGKTNYLCEFSAIIPGFTHISSLLIYMYIDKEGDINLIVAYGGVFHSAHQTNIYPLIGGGFVHSHSFFEIDPISLRPKTNQTTWIEEVDKDGQRTWFYKDDESDIEIISIGLISPDTIPILAKVGSSSDVYFINYIIDGYADIIDDVKFNDCRDIIIDTSNASLYIYGNNRIIKYNYYYQLQWNNYYRFEIDGLVVCHGDLIVYGKKDDKPFVAKLDSLGELNNDLENNYNEIPVNDENVSNPSVESDVYDFINLLFKDFLQKLVNGKEVNKLRFFTQNAYIGDIKNYPQNNYGLNFFNQAFTGTDYIQLEKVEIVNSQREYTLAYFEYKSFDFNGSHNYRIYLKLVTIENNWLITEYKWETLE